MNGAGREGRGIRPTKTVRCAGLVWRRDALDSGRVGARPGYGTQWRAHIGAPKPFGAKWTRFPVIAIKWY